MAEIRMEKVSKMFGDNAAVDNINLTARDKEFLVLVGPSGCGKTTTLRMIAGLQEVTTGDIFIGGYFYRGSLGEQRTAKGSGYCHCFSKLRSISSYVRI